MREFQIPCTIRYEGLESNINVFINARNKAEALNKAYDHLKEKYDSNEGYTFDLDARGVTIIEHR